MTDETQYTMTDSKRRQALREAAVLLSCVAFLLAVGVPAMMLAARIYSAVFSFSLDQYMSPGHALGLIVAVMGALLVGAYAGVFVWIALSRRVFGFSRDEVLRVMHTGLRIPVLSRFDDWLVARVFH